MGDRINLQYAMFTEKDVELFSFYRTRMDLYPVARKQTQSFQYCPPEILTGRTDWPTHVNGALGSYYCLVSWSVTKEKKIQDINLA